MITTNILTRVYMFRFSSVAATLFTIEVDSKQYLITAKHAVQTMTNEDHLEILQNGKWRTITTKLIGHCADPIDISVLATDHQISDTFHAEPTMEGLIYGQEVYFLGFPYGETGHLEEIQGASTLPFVKKAIVSCFDNSNGVQRFYLDGHNNPGFSGGPVVFRDNEDIKKDMKIAGVISGFRFNLEPIYINGTCNDVMTYKYNTGIILAYNIYHAIELINGNPAGHQL